MICVSLSGLKTSEILNEIKELPMVELRLDLMANSLADIEKIFRSHPNLIATCRPNKLSDQERKKRLSAAITGGAAYVDIENEAGQEWKNEIKEMARQNRARVIISSHNFQETPASRELISLVQSMQSQGAELVKLACQCNSIEDSARILSLYAHFTKLIAIGMGPLGIVTRIAAPFLGAPFTFAAGKAGITAPGQLPYHEMQQIFQIMNKGE